MKATAQQPLRVVQRTAESALYERHARYVAHLAFRLLGRDGDVDDLVQDTFLEAFRGMPPLEDERSVRSWLATVVVRLCGRKLRRRRIATFFGFDDGAHDTQLIAQSVSPETSAQAKQVYDVLQRLPVRVRLAWTLRHIEGESLDEVAAHCGCSLATAKRLIASANEVMRGGDE